MCKIIAASTVFNMFVLYRIFLVNVWVFLNIVEVSPESKVITAAISLSFKGNPFTVNTLFCTMDLNLIS